MRESEVTESAATDPGVGGRPRAASMAPTWLEYLRPLRFDHWIKNLVVPVGSLLALAARRSYPDGADVAAILLAFVVSGLVSSVNYAVNEVLDAPFDARHPTKRDRPIPSGRVRVAPLLGLTTGVALLASNSPQEAMDLAVRIHHAAAKLPTATTLANRIRRGLSVSFMSFCLFCGVVPEVCRGRADNPAAQYSPGLRDLETLGPIFPETRRTSVVGLFGLCALCVLCG
jgi:hypothetical protein